jgi:hypothetical protein
MFRETVMSSSLGISGINGSSPLYNYGTSSSVSSTAALLESEFGLSTSGLYGGASTSGTTYVELSGVGQLLSATTTFQSQLQSLQPGTATSGGGQGFGTNLASLSAETQNFVDAFNGLQSNISNINNTSNLLGGSVAGASGLTQSLNALAQTTFANGSSTLTNLSQIGITYAPPTIPGGGGNLSINMNTLQSAFNTDATGAFSLLTQAASAFGNVAGNFVNQAGSQYSSLASLAQTSGVVDSFTGSASSLLSQTQSSSGTDLNSLLLTDASNGSISLQQAMLAINQYSMVSTLLG